MNALSMKEPIEELWKKENPEQTEKEKTEELQELEIYFCKTPTGRRIWRTKGSNIKRFGMSPSS